LLNETQKEKAVKIAEKNTKRNEEGLTVIEKDDVWRDEN
jgi:hypothetical protein